MAELRLRRQALLRTALGLLLSLACLVLLLRGVQWKVVEATLAQIRLPLLAVAVGVELFTFWAIAVRWQRLFLPHPAPTRGRLFEILNIAQLVNALLPAKLGPLVRAYLAGRGDSDRVAFALTTIVGEKVLEGVSLLMIALGLLPFTPLADWLQSTVWIGISLLFLLFGLFVVVASQRKRVIKWTGSWLARWPRLRSLTWSALSALDVWRNGYAVLAVLVWSLFIWAVTVLLNQLLLWSLHIQVPPVASVFLLVVLQIGVRVPSSPGSIGVFHYLSVITLSLFGVDKSVALSYGVMLHLVTYLPASLLGSVYLAKAGYSLGQLRQDVASVNGSAESGAPLENQP